MKALLVVIFTMFILTGVNGNSLEIISSNAPVILNKAELNSVEITTGFKDEVENSLQANRNFYGKSNPDQILNVYQYRQNDPQWSSILLGHCNNYTIGSDGCAITCEAMLLKSYGININPAQYNTWLKANSGFSTGGCDLIFSVINNYPNCDIVYTNTATYTLARLKQEIDQGDPVIVYLVRPSGITHFIVCKGYINSGLNKSDFKIWDPLQIPEQSLSSYPDADIRNLRTFDNVMNVEGYGSISTGLTLEPNPVQKTRQVRFKFTLKETSGAAILFEKIVITIMFNGSPVFELPYKTNVNLPANGTYTYNEVSDQFGPGTSLGPHSAVVKGYKNGVWFTFTTVGSGQNPVTFNVINPTTEITKITEVMPTKYNLLQNYPNPFNPSTNIQFDLPKDGFVKINIYDMLGKEVANLVNEDKMAGSYLVSYNGASLSSGVYFYRIETQDFIDTKRMILMK